MLTASLRSGQHAHATPPTQQHAQATEPRSTVDQGQQGGYQNLRRATPIGSHEGKMRLEGLEVVNDLHNMHGSDTEKGT